MYLLQNATTVLNSKFNGRINKSIFDDSKIMNRIDFKKFNISRSLFKQVIADVSYIDDFEIEDASDNSPQESIITLYDTKTDTKILLKKLGINILSHRIIDDHTVLLNENELEVLLEKAPYLVAMATTDLSELSPEAFVEKQPQEIMNIPNPSIEPTIGVIDTLFDTQVYFSKWVEYHEMISKDIPKSAKDYNHGTSVSSIIVDGPRLNPWLDDGCGRFKVRHFGVTTGGVFLLS